MFTDVTLTPDDAQNQLLSIGAVISSDNSGTRMDQPCPAFDGGCCSVYDDRPFMCRSYRCDLLKAHESGTISTEEAELIIAEAIELRDNASRGDETQSAGAHSRLHSHLLAHFDATLNESTD